MRWLRAIKDSVAAHAEIASGELIRDHRHTEWCGGSAQGAWCGSWRPPRSPRTTQLEANLPILQAQVRPASHAIEVRGAGAGFGAQAEALQATGA